MSCPDSSSAGGFGPNSMGTKAGESNPVSIITTGCSAQGGASVCGEGNDPETSHNFHSQSTAIAGDNVTDDDEEFEREMRLMLLGHHPQTTYSRKVFLGGLPSYTNSDDLQQFFSAFGSVQIVWPLAENGESEQGYAFAVFASADSVIGLLNKCSSLNGKYTISAPVSGHRYAIIHIRVWLNRNAKYCIENNLDVTDKLTKNAVFVGGLPRTVTAKELFDFMSLAFGDVIMAQIEASRYSLNYHVEVETDYPKGAGCVVFRYRDSFLVAIARRFTSFKFTDCFKKVELKPYLMRLTQCDICQKNRARNFCPQLRCLKYMCESCWQQAHIDLDNLREHLPMVRSPPVRGRSSTANSSTHRSNQHETHGAAGRSQIKAIEGNEKVKANARNLYGLVSSLPVAPAPLFECESEPSRDWNTDCGMFDGRGPPPHAGTHPAVTTSQTHSRRCDSKNSGAEPYSLQGSHPPSQRVDWNKRTTQHFTNTSHPRIPRRVGSHSYYTNTNSCNTSERSHGNMSWTGGYGNTINFHPTASTAPYNLWSDRVSAFANSSLSRPVVMSHINHFVRARTSFSPTIRRPNRRPCNAQAQKLTNNTNSATKKDLGDSVTVLVSQFQLF